MEGDYFQRNQAFILPGLKRHDGRKIIYANCEGDVVVWGRGVTQRLSTELRRSPKSPDFAEVRRLQTPRLAEVGRPRTPRLAEVGRPRTPRLAEVGRLRTPRLTCFACTRPLGQGKVVIPGLEAMGRPLPGSRAEWHVGTSGRNCDNGRLSRRTTLPLPARRSADRGRNRDSGHRAAGGRAAQATALTGLPSGGVGGEGVAPMRQWSSATSD